MQRRFCDTHEKQRGYIRTLEIALGWVFENVSGSEGALDAVLTHEGGRGQALLTGNDPGGGERLHKRWRESRVHKGIDHILSGGNVPVSRPQEGDASVSTSVGLLRLPEDHWRLLDIYFSYTHSWLPILGKQGIYQASYLYPAPGLTLDPREPSSAAHAELWSALALASFQDLANSTTTSSPRDAGKDDAALSPAAIYLVARSLIPLEDGPFQIHHSRALLLLSLANLGRGRLTPAWLLVGSAIRIALDINANVNTQQSASASASTDNGRERQRIQSVLIACFIIDTVISARDNKPPHLKAEDMQHVLPVQEDGLDQWKPI